MAEITDLRTVWRRKRRWRRFGSCLLMLVIAFAVLVVGVYWEDISHWFAATDEGESLLISGQGWPAEVQGTQIRQCLIDKDHLAVVTDLNITRFDKQNRYHSVYTHSMANPLAAMSGDWTAVWSTGSTAIKLYSPKKQVFSKTTDNPVLAATVSSKGQVAASTLSERYNTTVFLWDKNGDEQLTYKTQQQVTALSLSASGQKLALAELGTKNGQLMATISRLSSNHDKADWSVTLTDVMPLAIRLESDQSVTVVGDTQVVSISSKGTVAGRCTLTGTLSHYAFSQDGRLALAMIPSGDTASTRLAVLEIPAKSLWNTDITGSADAISLSGDTLLAVTSKTLFALDASTGNLTHSMQNNLGAAHLVTLGDRVLAISSAAVTPITWPAK